VSLKTAVIEKLLLNNFDPDEVIDLAWKSFINAEEDNIKCQYGKIVYELLRGNSRFPIEFDYKKATSEIQSFVDMCEVLHDAVKNSNFSRLEEKIKAESNLIYFYNQNNQSLLGNGLTLNNNFIIKNFSFFIENGLLFGSHEDMDNVYLLLSKSAKKQIRETQKTCSLIYSEEHLQKLILKSRIGRNCGIFSIEYYNHIQKAFKTLNSNNYCKKIMKIAALFKNLKIYFDFKNDSTYYMDPATSYYSKGIIYEGGSIFIGAKYLVDENRKSQVIGVLAHELCHLAVYIAFMNRNFDPFPTGESDLKRRFIDKIMVQCKKREAFEKIIANVFISYPEQIQDSEMIVTVPQMLMQYIQSNEILGELEGHFEELFRYSREVVDPELDRSFPILKDLFGERIIKYANLTEMMKAAILNTNVNFQGEKVTLLDLIGNNEAILNQLSSENIRRILVKKDTLDIGLICELNLKYGFTERNFLKIKSSKAETHKEPINLEAMCNKYKNIEKGSFLILADFAGTGKTTTFKECTRRLKEKYPKYWVSFIDLRKCSNVFENYKNNPDYFTSWSTVVNDVLLEIIGIKDDFEKQIFQKLIFERKVILLLDGFDEINPKYNKLLENILEVLKVSDACPCLWISTRPLYAEIITNILDKFAYKFSIFKDDDIKKFVFDILKNSNFKNVQNNIDDTANVILKYINNLSEESQRFNNIDNPLMIQIITELCIDPMTSISLEGIYI